MQYSLHPLIETDAHEGLVWVDWQKRLYFTSKPSSDYRTPSAIRYFDFKDRSIHTVIERSNMANGMCLAADKNHLLVAEQGFHDSPGCISRINLNSFCREIIVDNFKGLPFNSPNKIVQANSHFFFTDPDYGYYQGFKPQSELPTGLYSYDVQASQLFCLGDEFIVPHGLALSRNQETLFLVDNCSITKEKPFYAPNHEQIIFTLQLSCGSSNAQTETIIKIPPQGFIDGIIIGENKQLIFTSLNKLMTCSVQGENLQCLYENSEDINFVNIAMAEGRLYATSDNAIYYLET
ncbi:SMP-30/gluconolactonase/LRE family protein [Microbulbifer sp. DLAB2-AA]|uniref:SMP-30/gluconolactonase/LRE family protein n=1 Tax=Microbulbifer sp. DLAB2-AA TaxID=3243394 RepID=UPI0040391A2C